MKKEILCKNCEDFIGNRFPEDSRQYGEHVKFVNGKAKNEIICDSCKDEIHEGDAVCAFSLWADYIGEPYSAWEKEFITI